MSPFNSLHHEFPKHFKAVLPYVVDQAGLELRAMLAPLSQMLGLKECTSMSGAIPQRGHATPVSPGVTLTKELSAKSISLVKTLDRRADSLEQCCGGWGGGWVDKNSCCLS